MANPLSLPNPSELAPSNRGRVLALCGVLAAVIFVFDLFAPLGYAEAVPYVAVVLISLWSPHHRDTMMVASGCTVLTVVGFFFSPAGATVFMGEVNRGLALFAIWATALLSLKVQEADASVRAKSEMLTGILTHTPAVVFQLDEQGYMAKTIGRGLQRIGLKHFEVAGRNGLEPPPELQAQLESAPAGTPMFYESHGVFNGSPWWFLNCVTRASLGGKAILGFGLDITDRKRAERRLAAHHAVTIVLAETASFTKATPQILGAICENLGLEIGAIWTIDHVDKVLRCAEVWHSPKSGVGAFELRTKDTTFARGIGLPGRVWETCEPAWIPDVVEDPNFPRAPVAAEEGLHAGFAFPIHTGTELLAVMEFFSREVQEPDEDLLAMFSALGSQIGQFIEHKRTERRLGAHHAVTAVLTEATSFPQAAPQLLEAICESLGWEMGAIWELDQAHGVLRCAEVWHDPSVEVKAFESRTREITLASGVGLPGRVWESGNSAWASDMTRDPSLPRATVAAQEGLHASVCFPITCQSEFHGIMEFFSREIQEPDQGLLKVFSAIGCQIGNFIEQKRNEEDKLKRSR